MNEMSQEEYIRLRDAAPELLYACETALRFIDAVCFNTPNLKKRDNYAGCASILRAAIDKYTGVNHE